MTSLHLKTECDLILSMSNKAHTPFYQNPMYRFLLLMTICSAVGLQGWRTLFNNFSVDIVGLNGQHIGAIQSVREIPGFMTFLIIYIILFFREIRLSALSIVVLGVGVALTGFFPSYQGLLITTFIMSMGFHYFETTYQSLSLQYFDKQTSPIVITKLRAYGSITNIAVGGTLWGLSYLLPYWINYLLLGSGIALIGLWGMTQNPDRQKVPRQNKSFILRKRYWLFYLLIFLSGARRQIFVTFAVFLLVKKFQFTLPEIAILFVLNNVINYLISPLVGKAIVAFGERKVLSVEYFCLLLVFTGYAMVSDKWMAALLYILDHIFFNCAVAIKTYFQKVGDAEDISSSMAVGFTINHIAAVFIPFLGGWLWMMDYRIPFVGGIILCLASLISTQFIKRY